MKKLNRILLAGLCALAMSTGAFARGTVAVMNVENTEVTSPGDKPLTAEQVSKAIYSALGARGWNAQKAEGDKIKATYTRGGHSATIAVTYSAKSYSIQYVDSSNLKYSQEKGGGMIHPTYNSWVKNLKTGIDTNLRSF